MGGDSLIDFKDMLNISECIDGCKQLEQVECPVKHHFSDGQYTRETFMPKGTFAIGKKHRYQTTNIILKGKLSIYNGKNSPILHIEAPCIFISDAGVQKMAYFHEDTIWVNSHPTKLKDIEDIEKEFIVPEKETKTLEV